MTLYYESEDDGERIIENHPDYIEFDDEGRLVINLDEAGEKKRAGWARVALNQLEDVEGYELENGSVIWVGHE